VLIPADRVVSQTVMCASADGVEERGQCRYGRFGCRADVSEILDA
jgi:hypothetical protein